jgi:hypothetical protein
MPLRPEPSIWGLVELFSRRWRLWFWAGAGGDKARHGRVARRRHAGGLLRAVMVLLVLGLVTVNAGGTFARLIESHLSIVTAASTSVGERLEIILDARIAEQAR